MKRARKFYPSGDFVFGYQLQFSGGTPPYDYSGNGTWTGSNYILNKEQQKITIFRPLFAFWQVWVTDASNHQISIHSDDVYFLPNNDIGYPDAVFTENSIAVTFSLDTENDWTYEWQGPNGFSATGNSIENLADLGYYLLNITTPEGHEELYGFRLTGTPSNP